METLTLADTESAISAAFQRWLRGESNSFELTLSGRRVIVNIEVRDNNSFDCGTPGYIMENSEVPGLRTWVGKNIQSNFTGGLAPCKNVGRTGQVNVHLRTPPSFNFHVNLKEPC